MTPLEGISSMMVCQIIKYSVSVCRVTTQASFYYDPGFVDVVRVRPRLDSEIISCEMLKNEDFENHVRNTQGMSRNDLGHVRRFLEALQCIWKAFSRIMKFGSERTSPHPK